MSNHEIIGQALAMLREPLSGYIFQQLNTIPEYKINERGGGKGFCLTFGMSAITRALLL